MLLIHNLQDLGLALEAIRDLLDTRAQGDRRSMLDKVSAALDEQDRLISERIATLEDQKARVAEAVAKVRLCIDCPHTPGADNNFCEPCQRTSNPLPDALSALF